MGGPVQSVAVNPEVQFPMGLSLGAALQVFAKQKTVGSQKTRDSSASEPGSVFLFPGGSARVCPGSPGKQVLLEALEPEEGVNGWFIAHTWHQCVVLWVRKAQLGKQDFFFAYLVQ